MNNVSQLTKIFLARVLAWPQDGDGIAYGNMHYTFEPKDMSKVRTHPKNGRPILPWAGTAATSNTELMRAFEYHVAAPATKDIYFCTSTQAYAEEKVSPRGFKYKKALRSAEAAVKLKALFIDSDLIDGKSEENKDKGYETPQKFAEALAEFLKATGLPKPTVIVASGGGFHMYWCLVEAMTPDKWMPLAYALSEATKRHGFKCDTQCTIDSARVLRLPGTKNYKYNPPREVKLATQMIEYDYLNSKIEAILEPYKVAVPYTVLSSGMTLLPPKTPLAGVSELAAGVDTSSLAPVNLDSLVGECGFITEALTTGGANYDNPLWNLTVLISNFTEGGRADAHRMSAGHPDYGPGETDELFDRKAEEKLVKNLGWPKCATIAQTGCKSCATCPHFGQGKSPLNFATKTLATLSSNHVSQQGGFTTTAGTNPAPSNHQPGVTPQGNTMPSISMLQPGTGVADPDLPLNYLRTPAGIILFPQAQDDGSTIWLPVSKYPMIDPWMQRDPWTLNFSTETEFGKISQICVPLKDVGTAEMRKNLQEQGFMITGGLRGFNQLSDFIMAWVTKLQETKDTVISSVPFGWLVRGGNVKGFVYGGKLHTPFGEEVASNSDPELARQFSPEGLKAPWIDAANMVTSQKRPALDAILASSFAAPLVRFTGHPGLLMSAYSVESGIGKSTALKVAQAVWGDPVKAIQSLSDTQNSVLNKMGELRSLPVYWDELKSDEDTKRFVDTVFRLTLGKEKSRMTSKVTQRTPGTWQTMMVAASNESLLDSIAYKTRATTAGIYRVFEFTVKAPDRNGVGQIDPTVAQRTLSKLHDNYGTIGMDYASFLGQNFAQIEIDLGNVLSQVGKEVGMHADERFWISLMGTVILGARYANQLGYTQIDEPALKDFLYATLREMRQERASQPVDMRNVVNVVNTLARFINENRARHTLVTNVIHRARGKPAAGVVEVVADASRLDSVHVHVGRDDHIVRIGQSYLHDWLANNNYPRHVFMKALQSELNATMLNGRLGAGTVFANAAEYLIEIDISGSPLMNFIDEA